MENPKIEESENGGPTGYVCLACHQVYSDNPGEDCKVCSCKLCVVRIYGDEDVSDGIADPASLLMLLTDAERKHWRYLEKFSGTPLEYISIMDLTARQVGDLFTILTLRRYVGKSLTGNTVVGLVFEELTDRCIENKIHLNHNH